MILAPPSGGAGFLSLDNRLPPDCRLMESSVAQSIDGFTQEAICSLTLPPLPPLPPVLNPRVVSVRFPRRYRY